MMDLKLETRSKKQDGTARLMKLEDFQAWREAIVLAEEVYKLTEGFPRSEQFGLTSQLQRAVVSVSANLAEGFGRQAPKDKEHFYVISRGSLYEVKSLLVLANRLHYLNDEHLELPQLLKCLNYIGALLRAHRGIQ